MIDLLLALHGLAQQRGDGLLPELAEGLRKMPPFGEGRLTVIDGDAGAHRSEKDANRSKVEQCGTVRQLTSL
jgi:hypothetical protein